MVVFITNAKDSWADEPEAAPHDDPLLRTNPKQENYVKVSQQQPRHRSLRWLLVSGLGVVFLAIAAIVLGVSLSQGEDIDSPADINDSEVQNPLTRMESFDFSLPSYTTRAIEMDLASPQALAYDWVKSDPYLERYGAERLLQRFALAVFYYSTQGDKWNATMPESSVTTDAWLSYDTHECEWIRPTTATDELEGGAMMCGPEDLSLGELDDPAIQARQGRRRRRNNRNRRQQVRGSYRYSYGSSSSWNYYSRNSYYDYDYDDYDDHSYDDYDNDSYGDDYYYSYGGKGGGKGGSKGGSRSSSKGYYSDDYYRRSLQDHVPKEIMYFHHRRVQEPRPEEMRIELAPWEPVRRLHISGNNLDGTLPPELALLTSVESIDFSFNKLRGSLPTQLFDSMKHLDSLILQGNLLNQTLPSELAKLTGLETLDLSSNHLSGRLFFPGIDALPNLKILNLANNVFTGPFPASQLTSLNYLQHLLLYQNQLTGTLVEEIGLMTSLVQLELDNNNFVGTIPTTIGNLNKLRYFLASKNGFLESIPTHVGLMQDLKILELNQCVLTGRIPSEFGIMTSLVHLWLLDNFLTGQLPVELNFLAKYGDLELLMLNGNEITGTVPDGMCYLKEGLQFECDQNTTQSLSSSSSSLCGCHCACESIAAPTVNTIENVTDAPIVPVENTTSNLGSIFEDKMTPKGP